MSTPHSTADELEQLADELDSLAAALASTPPRFELGPMVRDELAEYEQRANRIGYPSIADGISRAKKRTPVSGAGEALRDVATHARQLAAERRQTANDDDRRAAEGDEQRDYAEERYNAALLVDPDELAERIAAGFDQAAEERTHTERQRDTARALVLELGRKLHAAALAHACYDCGAPAGAECRPEYGCDDASRAAGRRIA